ncbi:hypothetical protein MMC12_002914 [Toensbergia leucococca]|nr:hypothetical protein [Toensbergia leucococca]
MKLLGLHGKGTSASIFKSQTSAFRSKLGPDFSFDFVDASFPSTPAAGIDLFYNPPYYAFWNSPAAKDIRASHKWLLEKLRRDGPYDGVVMFSQGCALIASFILYHQAETPHLPLPFKVAIFICGGVPLPVLEDLGLPISPEAREWDSKSSKDLQKIAASVATMQPGVDRWFRKDDEAFDLDTPINHSNVYGLDFTQFPSDIRINIPTVHIYGSKDPRYPASIQLAQFCKPSVRRMYDHEGGHDVPRTTDVSENIAELVNWSAMMADRWNDC